jgi:hypothetical protein
MKTIDYITTIEQAKIDCIKDDDGDMNIFGMSLIFFLFLYP